MDRFVQRVGNWEGYLHCLEEFLPWCFALNRHNYARDLSYYLISMRKLKTGNPNAYNYLNGGGFSGSLSGEKHTQIPMDQIIETTINRSNKRSVESLVKQRIKTLRRNGCACLTF